MATTNALLAGLTLLILLLTAAVFNQAVEENDKAVRAIFAKVAAPFTAVLGIEDSLVDRVFGKVNPVRKFAPSVLALGIAAAIYGLEEPDFGLNTQSLVLFLSYLAVFGLLTYLWDGTQLMMSKRYGIEATIKVFPIGVAVALICVALTRITGFVPGLMYGFVAAHTIVGGQRLTKEQEGKEVLYPSLALLAACLLAWFLAEPLRNLAESDNEWFTAIPEGVAIGLFAAGLQSLFLQLLPFRYMDGLKLLQWSKLAWLAISLVSFFLFWEVFLNADEGSITALEQTSTIVVFSLILGCLAFTIFVYLGLHFYSRSQALSEAE